jgi:hypothetical protein
VHPWAIGKCFVALLVLEFEKQLGFFGDTKRELFVVNVVLRAREIPNSSMTFLKDDGGYAIVAFLTHEHLNYKVYNSESEWACYECFRSQKGNICKHQIKVIMFLCLDLTEGTIACYYGPLNGTLNDGFNSMLNPCPILTPFS